MTSVLWYPTEKKKKSYLKEQHPLQSGQAFDVHRVYDNFTHRGSLGESQAC